jgi:hypothetical protein
MSDKIEVGLLIQFIEKIITMLTDVEISIDLAHENEIREAFQTKNRIAFIRSFRKIEVYRLYKMSDKVDQEHQKTLKKSFNYLVLQPVRMRIALTIQRLVWMNFEDSKE